MSSEIRQNKATKEWVIISPSRGKRPHDFGQRKAERQPVPRYQADCPFCPGNEERLTPILYQASVPGSDSWQTRVVPNKFPALTPDNSVERYGVGPYVALPGYGQHEVVIESPRHDQELAGLGQAQLQTVINTYHQRYLALCAEPKNTLILIFRNHGPRAGASLLHPHSQVISTGIIPRHLRWREEEAERYYDEWGHCVFCDILAFEAADRQRVVLENESYLAFVPFAAEVPFELWIMPKRHQSDFAHTSNEERGALAQAMQSVLGRLHTKLNDPDYNYVFTTYNRPASEPHVHWYLRIRPRLVTRAGFEIGSGIRVNPSLPEADAAFLNDGERGVAASTKA